MDAEAFVSLLIHKLENLLLEEARTSDDRFKSQIQTALRNLRGLNNSLKDADEDHDASINEQRVVHLLRALYSAQDFTNTLLIVKELSNRSRGEKKYGFKKIFQRPLEYIKSLQSQILFRKEMKKFKNEIRALSSASVRSVERKEAVSINEDVVSVATNDTFTGDQNEKDCHQRQERWERIPSFRLEEETVCGLEQEIKDLVAQLVPEQYRIDYQSNKIINMVPVEQYHEQSTQVIVVVGDQGSGKTTLVRSVYCREDVMRHFDERAWVDVSSKSSTRSVLIDILGQITNQGHLVMETLSEDESLLEEELKWKISKLLEETRYLIVLDDVETPKVWEALQEVLCSSTPYGSRIIITTRNKDVKHGDDSALQVPLLNDEDSWKLFTLMVQVPKDALNSSEFIKLKKQILKIGGGSPYQILLLTSLLSERRSLGEWSRTIECACKQEFDSLLLDKSTNSNPSSEEEIQTAISSMQFLNQSWKDAEDHEGSSSHSKEEALSINDATMSFQNDKGQHSHQQRPERIFGLKEQITKLVARLIPVDNRDDSHSTQVIAVVGEGGLGKTTLVKTVYGSADVKRHFIKSAWINVPSEFKARDVFINILKQINQDKFVEVTASEGELRSSLSALLKKTRYLIVLEDVKTSQVWEALRDAIFSSSQGGKIIVTTRNAENVPKEASSTVHVHPLNKEDSWKLFLKKVQKADVSNNSEQMTIKEDILKKCDGLPSRILLLRGLLYTKVNYREWSAVIEHVNDSGRNILDLSYGELDPKLKPCFLYMGLFPRAFEIPVRRLIHLWCAEGFVKAFDTNQEIDPEDLAEIYFEELVGRNMIQVTTWKLDGSPKTCRMPSFLYDVFSPEAENAKLYYHELSSTKQPQFAVRQMEAYLGIVKDFPPILEGRNICSYVAFDARVQGSPDKEIFMFLKRIINNRGFGLLTVLDLEGVYKPMLSDDTIGKLLLLSYLGLRSTFVDSLPSSVGNLPYLETLDVNHTKIEYLPSSIWKAKKLRHLYLNWIHSDITVDQNVSNSLSSLHTLRGLSIKDGGAYIQNLRKLRMLGLTCRSESAMEGIAKSLDQLRKLQYLKLMYVDRIGDIAYLNLQKLKGLDKLQQLYLLGIQLESSALHSLPHSLKILTLSHSELEYDPMPLLGQLPRLKILRLFGKSYRGKRIECLKGGFPELRVLKLWKLTLKDWTVQAKAMPCLRELEIRSCQYLELPTGLQNVTTLKELVLTNMPSSFRAAVEGSLSKNVSIKVITRRSSPLPE